MSNKKWVAVGAGAVVVVAGIFALNIVPVDKSNDQQVTAPVTSEPSKQTEPVQPAQPKPESSTQAKDSQQNPQTQEPQQETPAVTGQAASDVVSFKGFTGSGSVSLAERKLQNEAFQIERIDWSESSKSITLTGKMRAFEAVGYVRVRDENKTVVEPETVIRAQEGAPAWSQVTAQVPLTSAYQGKVLHVEFYTKSAKDGSRTNLLTVPIKPE